MITPLILLDLFIIYNPFKQSSALTTKFWYFVNKKPRCRRFKVFRVKVKTSSDCSQRTRDRIEGPYQSLLPGSQRSHRQVVAALVKGVDVDAPVGVRLLEPVLQHVLKVNALPVAHPGVELDLQRADADVAAALLGHGLESEDLQVDGGGLLQRPQVHPQLRLQHLGEHKLRAELEEAAAGLAVHLHQGLRCGEEDKEIFIVHNSCRRFKIVLVLSRSMAGKRWCGRS